jgi:hypothetical protein
MGIQTIIVALSLACASQSAFAASRILAYQGWSTLSATSPDGSDFSVRRRYASWNYLPLISERS